MNEEVLSITIDHTKPLELKLFTASMLCIESQYKRYLVDNNISDAPYNLCINIESQHKSYLADNSIKDEKYNLGVREGKQGSISIDFIKKKGLALIENHVIAPFIEKYLKPKIEKIAQQKIKDETGLTLEEIKEILSIVSVVSGDYNSAMDMNVHIGDKNITHYRLDGIQANAVANECMRLMKAHPSEQAIKKNVVLHWKHGAKKTEALSIERGIIEEIEPNRPVRILCSDALKSEMVSENKKHPFNMFYIVDVEVKTVAGKPVAYIVKRIHDKGVLDDK